jgi:colicin import membrane protein
VVQGPTPQVPSPAQSPSQTPSTQQPLTATQMPGAAAARPLTRDEQKALDRSHQQEEVGKATDAKARMKQADVDRRNAKAEQENQAKQAQVQAKHDAEAAKVASIQAKRQAQVDAAETKRLAELDRIRQKALDEAAAKAKAAEDRYQAERSRKQK